MTRLLPLNERNGRMRISRNGGSNTPSLNPNQVLRMLLAGFRSVLKLAEVCKARKKRYLKIKFFKKHPD